MNFTNQHNLPAPLFRALCHDGYNAGTRKADISVTRLIAPPKQVTLLKRHEKELSEDASSRLYSLLGQSIHSILEKAVDSHSIAEERLYIERDGWVITGQTDLYESDKTLSDFKVTSVYSFLLGEKEEWENQLNLNAVLVEEAGFAVEKLQIVAILRDWQQSKAAYDPYYPQAGVIVKQYQKWDKTVAEKYISERIAQHKRAQDFYDNDIPVCFPKERWAIADSWAVIANGNKKATGVRSTETEAKQLLIEVSNKPANKKKSYKIEYRKGGDRKCESYCAAAKFCNYWQEHYADKETQEDVDSE